MNRINHSKAQVLFESGQHRCLMFSHLVQGDGVQSNQFLLMDGYTSALIDPGGDLTFAPLSVAISQYVPLRELTYILASHQDPDIIASLGRWMMQTQAKVVCSQLWARFLPHLAASFVQESHGLSSRIIAMPDHGGRIAFGGAQLHIVPAHFLHSVGNVQFYDPVSRILFSGDMAASLGDDDFSPTEKLADVLPAMISFHRRYMASRKVCQLWANMVRTMKVDMIVPQHGRPLMGAAIPAFLDWISELDCGVDLMSETVFRAP